MALNSGTPNISWIESPSSSDLVQGFNRIEGNTEDLEDSKVENVSGVVDLMDQTAPSTDADVDLELASDASLLWDESEDEFVLDGRISAVKQTATIGSEVTYNIGASSSQVVPSGIWANVSDDDLTSVNLQVYSSNFSEWVDCGFQNLMKGRQFVSDGVNVRFENASLATKTVKLRKVA